MKLSKRETIENINPQIRYDDSADVLYISFGYPRPGTAVEINQGNLIRVDPYTDEIVGMTFLNFKERYMSTNK